MVATAVKLIHCGSHITNFPYIRDVVDDLIEKVLEDGGDVEFVDNGMLMHL